MYSMFPQNQLFRPARRICHPLFGSRNGASQKSSRAPRTMIIWSPLYLVINGSIQKSHINSGLLAEASNTHRHYMKKDRNPQQRNIKPWCCECFPQTYLTYPKAHPVFYPFCSLLFTIRTKITPSIPVRIRK